MVFEQINTIDTVIFKIINVSTPLDLFFSEITHLGSLSLLIIVAGIYLIVKKPWAKRFTFYRKYSLFAAYSLFRFKSWVRSSSQGLF